MVRPWCDDFSVSQIRNTGTVSAPIPPSALVPGPLNVLPAHVAAIARSDRSFHEIQFDEITGKTIIIPSNSTYIAISDDGLSYKLYDILTSTVKPQVCAFGSGIILVAGETTESNSIIVNSGTFTTPLIDPLGSGINIQNFFIKT